MIPPPLREHLVRKLTQKLVESPTFNSLVHNTQGTISAFLDGIEEGRKQKEAPEVKRSDNPDPTHQQQQSQSSQSASHQTYSRTHDFEKPRSSSASPNKDPRTPPPESTSSSTGSSEAPQAGLTDLEAFLRRTKASLEEAERRADAQRKNKS